MNIEYEATFANIDKDDIRAKLKKLGAKLVYPEFLQKRYVFELPKGHEKKETWLRVRQEHDKTTLSIKSCDGENLEEQKEIDITIDDMEKGRAVLNAIGCQQSSYWENTRELWKLKDVEITLDTWPFLEPGIEIEGQSKKAIKEVSEKLGFNWKEAIFASVCFQYSKKYNIPRDRIYSEIPKITFDMENPFLKIKQK